MKLLELINSKSSLEYLSKIDLPIKVSYKLSVILNIFNKHYEIFNKKQNELVIKYGEKIDESNYKVTDGNMETYLNDLNELFDTDIEIDSFKKINLSEFNSEFKINTLYLTTIHWILESDI